MKTKITSIIAYVLLVVTSIAFAQEKVSVSILQDVKLATLGDKDRNYSPFTTDILIRVNMQGKQQEHGYMIVFPEYEYADIAYGYNRYSANVGYTFNKLFLEDLELSASIGYGFITRKKKSNASYGFNGIASYKLTKNTKILLNLQYVNRTDLGELYGKTKLRISGFAGIEINLN